MLPGTFEGQGHARELCAAAAFICVLAFTFQGSRGLWSPDEGRYVPAAAAMLENGDYLVTRFGHKPYLNKPPLMIWGIAAGLKVFGHNEWGARASQALWFVATAFLVGALGRALWGFREGLLAAVVYATLPLPYMGCNAITPDTPLTLWLAAVLLCFWKSISPSGRTGPWKALLGLCLGLGALTKGPAALIPTGALFVYLVLTRQVLRFFLTPWLLLGAVLTCLPVVCWYVPVIRTMPGAAEYLWDSQVWGRLVSAQYNRNAGLVGALAVYGPALVAGTLPWAVVGLVACLRLKPPLRTAQWWSKLRERPAALLLLLWCVVPTVILAAASSKLPLYILPVFPALALVFARACVLAWGAGWTAPDGLPSRRWWVLIGVWGVLLLGAKAGASYWPADQDMRAYWGRVSPHLPAGPHRIVAVDPLDLKGLAFYGAETVTEVAAGEPYPDYVPMRPLQEEVAHIPASRFQRVFLHKQHEAGPRHPVTAEGLLKESKIAFEAIPLSDSRQMTICAPGGGQKATRLAWVFDSGAGGVETQNTADALYHLSREFDLDGVVFLNHAFCRPDTDCVWTPYRRVLGHELPFYSMDHGEGLPPRSRDSPYYPASFGSGRVWVFLAEDQTATLFNSPHLRVSGRVPGEGSRFGFSPWKVLATHELPLSENVRGALWSECYAFVMTSDCHIYAHVSPNAPYVDHDLLAETASAPRWAFLPPSDCIRRQLIVVLETTPETCTFRVYDTLRRPLKEWVLQRGERIYIVPQTGR